MSSVLAVRAWYTSAPVLGLAGVAVGALAVVTAILIWRAGPPRKRLVYWVIDDMSVMSYLQLKRGKGAGLRVRAAAMEYGQSFAELAAQHIVTFQVVNTGRTDIRTGDFERGHPLVFDFGVTILRLLDPEWFGFESYRHLSLAVDGSKVSIEPVLLRRYKAIRIAMLTSGQASVTCDSQLADVTVYERTDTEELPLWVGVVLLFTFFPAFILFIATMVLQVTGHKVPHALEYTLIGFGAPALIIATIYWQIRPIFPNRKRA